MSDSMQRPADFDQRQRGLDPTGSFIVQAPAGSGKTELLSQRFLRLLAGVDQPESIIAITFTRKAAAEMRVRILGALNRARDGEAPEAEHARQTWMLAREALARDTEQGWNLLTNPRRLRVLTIDALCASIARQQPVSAGIGSLAEPSTEPSPLYAQAARDTLAELERDDGWAEPLSIVLRHLGNDVRKLTTMLEQMLAGRDQWLRHVVHMDHEREALEAVLAGIVTSNLQGLSERFSPAHRDQLRHWIAHARGNLTKAGKSPEKLPESFPDDSASSLTEWQKLSDFLLTAKGSWRVRLTVAEGFPSSSKKDEKVLLEADKAAFRELLDSLAADPDLEATLMAVRTLPNPAYTDAQWDVLNALSLILTLAAGKLEVVFREHGQVDYAAVSQAAGAALRDVETGGVSPSELALILDYRIQHLLIDEFQDTSVSQWMLLEQLTEGWVNGDGRTLFAVGDPMQSIYRFRQAEVGLFLRAREEGINQIALDPLTLTANFRSQAGVVDWVNQVFPRIFGTRMDIIEGAVAYSASLPVRDALPGDAVQLHAHYRRDYEAEAARIIRILDDRPPTEENRVAVLVRSRSHLLTLAAALRESTYRFRAVEIDVLSQRPAIQDLLALTRALLHPADRAAWLAVFRAPWCALSLLDLHRLAQLPNHRVLSEALDDEGFADSLDENSRARWQRSANVLIQSLTIRGRQGLRAWVEGCWLGLGGPATARFLTELDDAEAFLGLLEQFDVAGGIEDFTTFESAVAKLYAQADLEAGESLQLMTIHKSKGLEFETVILPGLDRTPGSDSQLLLRWMETASTGDSRGAADFLLAPIKAEHESEDAIYNYLKGLDREKGRHEDARLLYVAVTRAIKYLHLLAGFAQNKDGEWKEPDARSLLGALYPATTDQWPLTALQYPDDDSEGELLAAAPIRFLSGHWRLPTGVGLPALDAPDAEEAEEEIEFSWAGETARHIGTAVHAVLEHLVGQRELPMSLEASVLRRRIEQSLQQSGVPEDLMESAIARSTAAVEQTLRDERGRWVLDPGHEESASELPLTAMVDNQLVNTIIDRTFVHDGIRWIIDYKTGSHLGGGLEHFLDEEQSRYRPQLERYARIMRMRDSRPIRVALYFPVMGGWREWDPEV